MEGRVWGTERLMTRDAPGSTQNGKQGEIKNLAEANAQAAVESAATGGTA
jgi:hypothetical protein